MDQDAVRNLRLTWLYTDVLSGLLTSPSYTNPAHNGHYHPRLLTASLADFGSNLPFMVKICLRYWRRSVFDDENNPPLMIKAKCFWWWRQSANDNGRNLHSMMKVICLHTICFWWWKKSASHEESNLPYDGRNLPLMMMMMMMKLMFLRMTIYDNLPVLMKTICLWWWRQSACGDEDNLPVMMKTICLWWWRQSAFEDGSNLLLMVQLVHTAWLTRVICVW